MLSRFCVDRSPFHFKKDRAVYTCDEGYQIVGVEKVVCQTSGQVFTFYFIGQVLGGAFDDDDNVH